MTQFRTVKKNVEAIQFLWTREHFKKKEELNAQLP